MYWPNVTCQRVLSWLSHQRQFEKRFSGLGVAHGPSALKARAKSLATGVFHWSVPETQVTSNHLA
jgi:hypothetical protein